MTTIVIYNPVSGDSSSESFVIQHVLPLLEKHGKTASKVVGTTSAGHAATILREYLEAVEGAVTVILASGDGTLQEIITELSTTPLQGVRAGLPPSRLHFVLIPCGTANALYSSFFPPAEKSHPPTIEYRLQSLTSFLSPTPTTVPLTLGIAVISSPPRIRSPLPTPSLPGSQPHQSLLHPATQRAIISTVVISTSLHATILRASESLRAAHPGIERFKIAAHDNLSKWYVSEVRLLPAAGGLGVQVYDPSTRKLVSYHGEDGDDEEGEVVDLPGPFVYFVSTVNVDRLEAQFRVTPLARSTLEEEVVSPPTFDIVAIRPFRDASVLIDDAATRERFAQNVTAKVLGAVYEDGKHIDLRYSEDETGKVVEGGEGPTVVEYFRCGGWEWHPDDIDADAHLLCSDGLISEIPKEGRVVCSAAKPQGADAGLMVYV